MDKLPLAIYLEEYSKYLPTSRSSGNNILKSAKFEDMLQ